MPFQTAAAQLILKKNILISFNASVQLDFQPTAIARLLKSPRSGANQAAAAAVRHGTCSVRVARAGRTRPKDKD